MKKILLGATALSLMGFAGGASAQEWSANVGGFMTAGIGYIDGEFVESEAAVINNSEVIFNFRLVADNGLTFGAKAEFENSGASNNVDEYVASVSGSFGTIEIGAEDGAMDRLYGGPAGGTAFTAAGNATGLVFDYYTGTTGLGAADGPGFGIDTDGEDTSDDLKVTYFTPTFSGFRAGVSFIPTDTEGPNASEIEEEDGEVIEVGANYSGDFGGFSVGVGAGGSFAGDGRDWDTSYGGSLNVGFGGFTIGGAIGYTDVDVDGVSPSTSYSGDYLAGSIGANYATGPWLFGLQYSQVLDGTGGTAADGVTTLASTSNNTEDQWGVSAGIDYALAPGVTVGATLEYADAGNNARTVDGTVVEFEDSWAAGLFMNLDY